MPPTNIRVEDIKPWKPVIGHIPEPPKAEQNPELARYYKALKEWKDSNPLYRHKNPRPETWIPRTILDTNYRLPSARETYEERQEYLAIVEELEYKIPPEYYDYWVRYFSKELPEGETIGRSGQLDGYRPGMINHPKFLEKNHLKYNRLPTRKMFPEEEKLYKLQEANKIKESLDAPDDDGMDYYERKGELIKEQKQKEIEEEKKLRDEVMRGTHWIDWGSVNEETIDPFKEDQEEFRISELLHPAKSNSAPQPKKTKPIITVPSVIELQRKSSDVGTEEGPKALTAENGIANSVLGFALIATVSAVFYGFWKLIRTVQMSKSKTDKLEKEVRSSRFRRRQQLI